MIDTDFLFSVAQHGTEMFRVLPDGRVTKNPDVSWDECAVTLFDALERTAMRRSAAALQEENATLRAAIERVRALHTPETRTTQRGTTWRLCAHCRDDDGFSETHPCPTLRALDGEGA